MVETLCTAAEAKLHAGKLFDTGLSAANWTTFINEAEGMVCLQTRVNWLDRYASLDDDYKKVLELMTAVLAANIAIKYNMNAYASYNEAQTIMNVNTYMYEENLRVLREKEGYKDFLINGEQA